MGLFPRDVPSSSQLREDILSDDLPFDNLLPGAGGGGFIGRFIGLPKNFKKRKLLNVLWWNHKMFYQKFEMHFCQM